MARKRRTFGRPPVESRAAALRRLCFLLLCAAGLAGLLSCHSGQRSATGTGSVRSTEASVAPLPTHDAQTLAQGAPAIRVAVLKDARAQIAAGAAEARILGDSGREIRRLAPNAGVQVLAGPSGLLIEGSSSAEHALRIESLSPADTLRLNGQDLAPVILIRPATETALRVVAQLDLEEYLLGVLAGEVPFERWHPEALKAQAIASRSYAFYQLKRSATEAYDVESTVQSQVFKAGYRGNTILSSAVNATRGLVLTYNGALFSAYFHSSCGGHTEPARNVFPEQANIKPLSGVPCSFCQNSPAFRWKMLLDKAALEQKLSAATPGTSWPKGAQLQSLEFLDAAGAPLPPLTRANQVSLCYSGGLMHLPGNQFRLLAGARELKSLLIERVADTGPALEISGGGYGHGVGLCQYGSQGMAQAGFNYAQVLGKYYPGAALTRMY
ncbi:MAG: SpoIID/LytB domain-containing protein [Planctomycetota bacterium]